MITHEVCSLILENYELEEFFIGQWFTRMSIDGLEVYQLTSIPRQSCEEFVEEYGFPVRFKIILKGNPNLNNDVLVATHDQIGWWDSSPDSDSLTDISVNDINYVLQEQDGFVFVEMDYDEDTDEIVPLLFDEKITICPLDYEEDFE